MKPQKPHLPFISFGKFLTIIVSISLLAILIPPVLDIKLEIKNQLKNINAHFSLSSSTGSDSGSGNANNNLGQTDVNLEVKDLIYLIDTQSNVSIDKLQQEIQQLQNQKKVAKTMPNILFYKTHKTGSSSVQNIMYRLALKHKMPILWSNQTSFNLDYPKRFKPFMARNAKHSVRMSLNHLAYSEELLDMFDRRASKKIFHLTILREPYQQLRSIFNYYSSLGTFRCLHQARILPNFLMNTNHYIYYPSGEDRRESYPFCQNPLTYDLGFDNRVESPSKIFQIIDKIEKRFDLVMILEHYYESMILLKDKLGLEYEDVISFKLNKAISRPEIIGPVEYGKTLFKKAQEEKNFALADSLIYNHFLKIFNNEVEKFGASRMKREVEILKTLTKDKFSKTCQVYEVVPEFGFDFSEHQNVPAVKKPWHPPKVKISTLMTNITENDSNYEKCQLLTMPEVSIGRFVRQKQMRTDFLKFSKKFKKAMFWDHGFRKHSKN